MKIKGPFLNRRRRRSPSKWYLSYFVPRLGTDGTPVQMDGKTVLDRKRPHYKSKDLAAADIPRLQDQYAAAGAGSFVHSRTAQADYQNAAQILPEGVSVTAAAQFYRKHHPEGEVVKIEAARDRFLAHLKKVVGATAHYKDMSTRTRRLAKSFASRDPNTITRTEAMTYLLNLGGSPRGKLNYKRAACTFYNWLLSVPLVDHNPFGGIKRKQLPKVLQKEIEFLTLEQVGRYLRGLERYDPELVAHEIVQLFAGVRADDEMATFRGEWVKAATHQVVTPAEMTKTGNRDVIEGLEENFWPWWDEYGREGALRPRNYARRWIRIRLLIQIEDQAERDELARMPIKTLLARKARPAHWPWNARRRTFCSYHVAKNESAAKTANLLRHKGGEAVLRNSYLGTGLTQADGVAYFAFAPKPVKRPIFPRVVARGIVRLQQDPAYQMPRRARG